MWRRIVVRKNRNKKITYYFYLKQVYYLISFKARVCKFYNESYHLMNDNVAEFAKGIIVYAK